MRSEANRVLKEKGQKIAEKLGDKAAEGDLKSVELLYKLSKDEDGQVEGPALTYSIAEKLANEPEWGGKGPRAADARPETAAERPTEAEA